MTKLRIEPRSPDLQSDALCPRSHQHIKLEPMSHLSAKDVNFNQLQSHMVQKRLKTIKFPKNDNESDSKISLLDAVLRLRTQQHMTSCFCAMRGGVSLHCLLGKASPGQALLHIVSLLWLLTSTPCWHLEIISDSQLSVSYFDLLHVFEQTSLKTSTPMTCK